MRIRVFAKRHKVLSKRWSSDDAIKAWLNSKPDGTVIDGLRVKVK